MAYKLEQEAKSKEELTYGQKRSAKNKSHKEEFIVSTKVRYGYLRK